MPIAQPVQKFEVSQEDEKFLKEMKREYEDLIGVFTHGVTQIFREIEEQIGNKAALKNFARWLGAEVAIASHRVDDAIGNGEEDD